MIKLFITMTVIHNVLYKFKKYEKSIKMEKHFGNRYFSEIFYRSHFATIIESIKIDKRPFWS